MANPENGPTPEYSADEPIVRGVQPWVLRNNVVGDGVHAEKLQIYSGAQPRTVILRYEGGRVAGANIFPNVEVLLTQRGVPTGLLLTPKVPLTVNGESISLQTSHGQAIASGFYEFVA
jgi:hypothetical protein